MRKALLAAVLLWLAGPAVAQVVTTTSLTRSPNPSVLGGMVTLTATVVDGVNPTGTMTFYRGPGNPIGSVPVIAGSAQFRTSALVLGTNSMIAAYSGDAGNLPSTSPARTQTVNPQPPGTRPMLLRDINLKRAASPFISISEMAGGVRLLSLFDELGQELWKTDGTVGGTGLLKDIVPGVQSSAAGTLAAALGPIALMIASDPATGIELWKSDGTAVGTQLVKDICPGTCGGMSVADSMFKAGANVWFFANDGATGSELWKSDGTGAGTTLVKDINPGLASSQQFLSAGSSSFGATMIAELNGGVVFSANDGAHGVELWKSDGTAVGTVLVKDITPGAVSTEYEILPPAVTIGAQVFFLTREASGGHTLWRTDGTDPGTISLGTFGDGVFEMVRAQGSVLNPSGLLIFTAADSANGFTLWKSDGTVPGTAILASETLQDFLQPVYLANLDGAVYFSAGDSVNGVELWKTDGTVAGTAIVQDIRSGGDSSPQFITNIGGKLYFFASDPVNGIELWKSDGSPTGAVLVKDINPTGGSLSGLPGFAAVPGGAIFFADDGLNGLAIWKTDGTPAGTFALGQVNFGSESSISNTAAASPAAVVRDKLFLVADDGLTGLELWVSDATPAGTIQLKDILPGTGNTRYSNLTAIKGTVTNPNGLLMFRATDGVNGIELWASDGTPGGTAMVKDINPGGGSSGNNNAAANFMVNVDGWAYFNATDGANGVELWKSDGTSVNTVMVKDIASGPASSTIAGLANMGGTLYFRNAGTQLWKSDGTDPGTVMVQDVTAAIATFTPVGSTLFFTVQHPTFGHELWKSDGTSIGTQMVKDINPLGSSSPSNLIDVAGTLFFTATDGIFGVELWKSDGTDPGTVMLADLTPGAGSSTLGGFARAGSILVFSKTGTDNVVLPSSPTQLWRSDGTPAGTFLLKDFCAGKPVCISSVSAATEHSGYVFFSASDETGNRVWRTDGTVAGTVPISTGATLGRVLGSNPQGIYISRNDLLAAREPHFFAFDLVPDVFGFTSVNATTSTVVTSNAIAATGFDIPVPISIDIGTYSIGCTASFVSTPGTMRPLDTVCVRHTTSPAPGGNVTSTLTIGGIAGSFTTIAGNPPSLTSVNSATFTVASPGSFTVTATGAPAPTLAVTGALPAGVTFTPATGVLAGTPSLGTVGVYPLTVTATNVVLPVASQSFNLTVAKVNQVITFAALADRSPGGPPFVVSATGGTSPYPVVFTTPDLLVCGTTGTNGTTVVIFGPGTCSITASQAGDADYTAASVTRSFSIRDFQAINFPSLADRLVGAPNFTLAATGGASGNPVVYTTTTPSVCLLGGPNGSAVALVGAGLCTINADQAGTPAYFAAPRVTRSFQVLPPTSTLSVSREGSAFALGTVTSAPSGITCGATCSAAFTSLSTVTLSASPGAGASFSGWTGACTGTGPCNVTMNGAKTVRAHFDPPSTPQSADVAITQAASPDPVGAGKDVVFTLTIANNGPANATNVMVLNGIPLGSSYVWTSPGCALASGNVTCSVGSLASGASVVRRVVVRPAAAGSIASNATVVANESEPNSTNNASSVTVTVDAVAAGTPVLRYRLYSDVTKEHHFTTDFNEYTVLGSFVGTWVQEGTVGKVLDNPGSFNSVAATPYYRLYDNNTRWHHWTTDPNEYYTLGFVFSGWSMEGVDGYILPTSTAGTTQLYRLNYPALGALHHWTIDANEYNTLITPAYGWVGEGGAGFVVQ